MFLFLGLEERRRKGGCVVEQPYIDFLSHAMTSTAPRVSDLLLICSWKLESWWVLSQSCFYLNCMSSTIHCSRELGLIRMEAEKMNTWIHEQRETFALFSNGSALLVVALLSCKITRSSTKKSRVSAKLLAECLKSTNWEKIYYFAYGLGIFTV